MQAPLDLHAFLSQLQKAKSDWDNLALARKRLRYYRWKTVEELDKHLLEFESSIKRTGGSLFWGFEIDDSHLALKSLFEQNVKAAFLPSKLTTELGLSVHFNVPSLSKFKSENNDALPDLLFVPAKFLIASSGQVFYAGTSKLEFEAITHAKHLFFIGGIDALLSSTAELDLAKGLYSCYELGKKAYPFELMTKPGKPDNRFLQQVSLLVIDQGRSALLHSEETRMLFMLQNFNLPQPVASLFWDEEVPFPLQNFLTEPFMSDKSINKPLLFGNSGYNRLSDFLPFEADIYAFFMQSRLNFMANSKSNFFLKLTKTNHSKLFLDPKVKLNHKRFAPFVKEKLLGHTFKKEQVAERTFIEQYYYDKRKI